MNRQDKELMKLASIIVSGVILMAVISFISFSIYMYIKHPDTNPVQFKIGR